MPNSTPQRRKVVLINPRFQISFIAFTTGMSLCTTVIFYGAISYFFWKFRAMGTAVGLPPDHVFFKFIADQQSAMNWIFVGVGVVAIAVLVTSGVYMSHRVAGPLVRLRNHMARVARGETVDPVKFREKDYFPELATAYNEQLDHLRGNRDSGSGERKAA